MATYEGWKNYETWCVALWINNEERLYRQWCTEVKELKAGEKESHWKNLLADKLKEWTEDERPELKGMWADLLGAALSEVDWDEIAEDLLGQ